ncbi:MAG: UvrD-helicase domain-containing protein [Bacteroidales bacterium]
MSPLRIYKASAGSGKTYALTMEYLRLLFRFPGMHRHILAVTFTNKAAGEMKHRILNRLHALAGRSEEDAGSELTEMMSVTGLDEQRVRGQAAHLLDIILNDYSGFSVETIDKFFQSVIRSFTREIGIQPGYNLELDHHRILSLAVEQLFQDITDHQELQEWLIRFAEERIEESRSWNFKNEMIVLGMQLFREAFQHLFLEKDLSLLDKFRLKDTMDDLDQAEKKAIEEIIRTGTAAIGKIRENGRDVTDFKRKEKSVASLFLDAAHGRELNFTLARIQAITLPEKWLSSSAPPGLVRLTTETLMPMLAELYNQQRVLNTVRIIRENFYTLGILGDLLERINAYTRERNMFLMADSSRFLRGIIGGNQVPFVYERTGNRFNHIMLDEFQDTSVFQYDNFRPLLDNSLASGYDNLVVGDVKQSIYRWRNSDWRLLASELEGDFRHQVLEVIKLNFNFRSREQIIRFSNSLFQIAPEILVQQIARDLQGSDFDQEAVGYQLGIFRKAYEDVVQQIPDNRSGSGGMVRLEFFGDQEDVSFQNQVLDRIPGWIEEIGKAGFDPGQTAILVRTKKEGTMVADRLLQHARKSGGDRRFRLISNESLLLMQNVSVSLLVSALHFLVRPGDELNQAELKYHCLLTGVVKGITPDRLFDPSIPAEEWLPGSFLEHVETFRQLPLFELVETLIQVFGLTERTDDLPYIQALQDLVIDLQRRDPMSIARFLDYWQQHASRHSISVSEELNAIRILTIHKAKGLEFNCVLIPFCNWEMTTDHRKANYLWCDTGRTPFSKIPVVPVRYSGSMKETLFSQDYFQERMKGYMDNLNLMYVAFTRAKDALYIGVPGNVEDLRKTGKIRHAGDLLLASFGQEPSVTPFLTPWKQLRSGPVIRIGSLKEERRKEDGSGDQWKFTTYPVIRRERLRVRLRSDEFFVDEEGTFSSRLSYGTIMHQIFSGIGTEKDLEPALFSMQNRGLIPEKDRNELQEKISEMIARPGIREWFLEKDGRRIFNERSILCGNGEVIRPDRVIVDPRWITVVDFKFGMNENPVHRRQVMEYVERLRSMGYAAVEGYLWYAMLDKRIKVTGS